MLHDHSVIITRTVDTDWIVIAIAQFYSLTPELKELNVEFGTGKTTGQSISCVRLEKLHNFFYQISTLILYKTTIIFYCFNQSKYIVHVFFSECMQFINLQKSLENKSVRPFCFSMH